MEHDSGGASCRSHQIDTISCPLRRKVTSVFVCAQVNAPWFFGISGEVLLWSILSISALIRISIIKLVVIASSFTRHSHFGPASRNYFRRTRSSFFDFVSGSLVWVRALNSLFIFFLRVPHTRPIVARDRFGFVPRQSPWKLEVDEYILGLQQLQASPTSLWSYFAEPLPTSYFRSMFDTIF